MISRTRIRPLLLSVALCFLSGSMTAVFGFRSYRARIPNGLIVPHPCKNGTIWEGVGHFNALGAGARNPFGLDFAAANKTWTSELCRKDSDGDGRTNGEELGDPNCVWVFNTTAAHFSTNLSHPGVCEPVDSVHCRQRAVTSDVFIIQAEWTQDACRPSAALVCPSVNSTDVRNQTVSIPRVNIPGEESSSICSLIHFENVASDFQLLATKPYLGITNIVHYITLFGCGEVMDQVPGTVFPCSLLPHRNCSTVLSTWTLGQNGQCFPNDTALILGLNGFTRLALQIQYVNPRPLNVTDDSGMVLFYAPQRGPVNSTSVLWVGSADFVIPPQREQYEVRANCTSQCTRSLVSKPLYVTLASTRIHYLGFVLQIEQLRNGAHFRYIVNNNFTYNSPTAQSFSPALDVLPGDELRTKCTFNSSGVSGTTFQGRTSKDDMACYGFLYYYPRDAIEDASCLSFGELSFCGERLQQDGCDPKAFLDKVNISMRQALLGSCDNEGRVCLAECRALVSQLRQREPCLRMEQFWQLVRRMNIQTKDWSRIAASLDSCAGSIGREESWKEAWAKATEEAAKTRPSCTSGAEGLATRGATAASLFIMFELSRFANYRIAA